MTELTAQLSSGLNAPICLTWELTYACNLSCIHCLSSSGRRDPAELSTEEALRLIDTFAEMRIFYVNIGGGEPMLRKDFFEIIEHAIDRRVGVKFSTNGTYIDEYAAARLAALDYLDLQISIDGTTPAVNDAVRGPGTFAAALSALEHLQRAGMKDMKISVVVTRHNVQQLDEFLELANRFGAQLRLTRLRPSGRGVDSWDELHPTSADQRTLYDWLLAHPTVLTGDSFFHLNAFGASLPGLNMCGAGRVVCLIDPVGDVFACPFVIDDSFKAGSIRDDGGFARVWTSSPLFASLREPSNPGACGSCGSYDACGGGCMAAKFFTGLPLDAPDPECVLGHGEDALRAVTVRPTASLGHSRPVTLTRR